MIPTARELYDLICSKEIGDDPDSLQVRVEIIQKLEKATGQYFKSTEDFHRKMKLYFEGKKYTARHLKQARKKKGWKQIQLAGFLGTSRAFVAHMESGRKSLTTKALRFIEEMEVQPMATPLLKTQIGNIYTPINKGVTTPQNGGQ